jgi:hypothetical protein
MAQTMKMKESAAIILCAFSVECKPPPDFPTKTTANAMTKRTKAATWSQATPSFQAFQIARH